MAAKLTILGSGGMMPTKKRYPASYLLEADDSRILLDCGFLTLARLIEYDVDLRSIKAVCVSHFHTDHFAHLLPLVHARWVDDHFKLQANLPLAVFGPETLVQRCEKLREVFWPEPHELHPLEFHEGVSRMTLGPFTIETFPVQHVRWFPSVGFSIHVQGRRLVYPGDIGGEHPMHDLVDRVKGADLLLIEAGNIMPTSNHFTVEQVLRLKSETGVKKVIVTHIREEHISAIRLKIHEADGVTIAEDGMTAEV